MSEQEIVAMLALGFTPGIGVISAKKLIEQFGSATEVFAHRTELPRLAAGFPDHLAEALGDPAVSERAKREWDFASRHDIRCLCLNDEAYPSRMRECTDAPLVLFYKGSADLNALHMVAIVGTRHITDYGRMLCTHFVKELKDCCPDAVIVSGLAYGVDICAHRAALDCGTDTVGVLAHGLDRIYPSQHRAEASRMLTQGGVLTEYPCETFPDRPNFVRRNRIIAGLCDATVVIESATKGGSLITAELASEYGRECFAFPGPVGAPYSEGCNCLIRDNKAILLQHADELVKALQWDGPEKPRQPVQRTFFPDLTEEEQTVVALLGKSPTGIHINTLTVQANIPVHKLSALLFTLEMKGVVKMLAGGNYRLLS